MTHETTDKQIRDRLDPHRELQHGTFIHYKTRNYYVVDAVSLLESDMTTVMVTYHPRDKADMSFIRTVENFTEEVEPGIHRFTIL